MSYGLTLATDDTAREGWGLSSQMREEERNRGGAASQGKGENVPGAKSASLHVGGTKLQH